MYLIHFRIPYTDPFNNRAYYHGAATSRTHTIEGSTVFVRDTETGFLSPYPAEVHAVTGVGGYEGMRPRRFKVEEV